MSLSKTMLFGLGAAALVGVGAEAGRAFKPPSTATVDIAEIFDKYEKRRDRQAELQAESKGLEAKLKGLEEKYKALLQEISLAEAQETKKNLAVQKAALEFEVESLKKGEVDRLRQTQFKYIQEIRDEITQEIRDYAVARDLDLVIEKTITAEGEGSFPGLRWPIVHYAKPELDITKEIADRLNRRYGRNP